MCQVYTPGGNVDRTYLCLKNKGDKMMKIIFGIICFFIAFALYCCLVVGKKSDLLLDPMLRKDENEEDYRKENQQWERQE